MQRWRRILGAILAFPVLILLDATPERGTDRRLAATLRIVNLLLFIAVVAGLFWLVNPVLQARDQVGLWLGLVVFGIIGVILSFAAVGASLHVVLLLWRGQRTMATVVSDADSVADCRFQFSDLVGRTHIVKGPIAGAQRAYGAGQQMPLIYWPGRPATFVIDRFGDKWGVPLIFFILGLLVLLPWSVVAFDLQELIRARIDIVAPMLFLMFGAICAALGFSLAVKALRFQRRALRAVGVIVASKSRRDAWAERAHKEGRKVLFEPPLPDPGASEWWIITVEFADGAGATRRAATEVVRRVGQQSCHVGDQQPILYDPGRPWEIRTDTSWNWLGPLVLGAFGIPFVAIGLVLWVGRS